MATLKESLQQNLFVESLDNYHTERRRNGTIELYSEGETIRADLEYHRGTGLYTAHITADTAGMPASASTNLKRQARLYDQLRGSGYELDSIDDTDPKQKHLDMKPIQIDHQHHLDQLVNDIISKTSTQQPKE